MGRDITVIGTHNLDTSNLQVVAEQLSKRFKINIEYGYRPHPHLDKLLGVVPPCTYANIPTIILGTVTHNHADIKTYELLDEYYQEKLAVSTLGESILKTAKFHDSNKPPSKSNIKYARLCIQFNNYELGTKEIEGAELLLQISKHTYQNWGAYFSRWWGLVEVFNQDDSQFAPIEPEKTLDFRTELHTLNTKLGGKKMYYVDDQSDVLDGLGEGEYKHMNWATVEKLVQKKAGAFLLDIPRYFLNKRYRKQYVVTKNKPLAFIDNFRDLPKIK